MLHILIHSSLDASLRLDALLKNATHICGNYRMNKHPQNLCINLPNGERFVGTLSFPNTGLIQTRTVTIGAFTISDDPYRITITKDGTHMGDYQTGINLLTFDSAVSKDDIISLTRALMALATLY